MKTDKDKNEHNFTFAEIDSKAPNKVQLMRTIKAEHGYYGNIELAKEDLRAFKKNFDLNKNRIDLAVDYGHNSGDEAAGWIKDIELANNDNQLWITVDWTPTAQKKIEDKEYRYLSADFVMKFRDPETGEDIGALMRGAGLTNRPFIKDMSAILSEFDDVELSPEQETKIRDVIFGDELKPNEKDKEMNLDDIKKGVVTLSDTDKKDVAKAMGITVADANTAKQLSDVTKERDDLKAENKKLSDDAAQAEKDAEFAIMLSDGKAVEAQREAFMEGNIAEFAKLSTETNTEETGAETGDNGEAEEGEVKDEDEAHAKLSELATAKSDKDGIEFSDALSAVIHDDANAKLVEKAGI